MDQDKLNIDDIDIFGGQEEVYELISLTEEDGSQTDYYIVDAIDVEKVRYILLVKVEEFENDSPDAYLFKETEQDGEFCTYEPVNDDAEYNKVMLLLQDDESGYEIAFE